ncbi:excinuclease ATPase subunit [Tatumella sp. UBA2305]|uniref:excinuclease ATPase subunit n=1 Tax=Tatumella sp. UBA2305 TaxID=1947647 RepID=UPI0025DD171D|nr:excinuclease ATPase subunit [Tatumella sp. UBA2305]
MKNKLLSLVVLSSALIFPAISQARDTVHNLPFNTVVQQMTQEHKLDGSVKFYLAGTGPKGRIISSGVVTNKKTNSFNKSDTDACNWALQSALLSLQEAAKKSGANAVINIVSFYKRNEHSDRNNYECHAGTFIAGTALKGDLANVR